MGLERYNNLMQMAFALSMVGWVAWSPENNPEIDPFDYRENNNNNDYFAQQQQFWNNDDDEQMLAPMVQVEATANYQINDNFHESKFIYDEYSSLSELQDLVSWDEAYRRGDLSFDDNTGYIYPIVNYEGNNEHLLSELQTTSNNYDVNGPLYPNFQNPLPIEHSVDSEPLISDIQFQQNNYDDGYGSGDTTTIGSPQSVSSLLSLNLDEISSLGSPNPSISDFNDGFGVEDVPGASGYDLPELNVEDLPGDIGYLTPTYGSFNFEELFNNDLPGGAFSKTKVAYPETLSSHFDDLDYTYSPLIDPTSDDYLGTFVPPNLNVDNSFDDPFQIKFNNSSLPDNKFISEALSELDDFDISSYGNTLDDSIVFRGSYEKTLESVEEVEQQLVETLTALQEGASGRSFTGGSSPGNNNEPTADLYPPPTPNVHDDHNYSRHPDAQQLDSIDRRAVDALASNFQKLHHVSHDEPELKPNLEKLHPIFPDSGEYYSPEEHSRTYAPVSRHRTFSNVLPKKEQKESFIWPDFPYTVNQIVDMEVNEFNELISKLDDMKQLYLKDIRKKGKNKFAARNCRKRKLDAIDDLDCNLDLLEQQKETLLLEQQILIEETRQIREKTEWLNNYILEHVFDNSGNSYSDSDYTLEYTTDGNVYLVPYVDQPGGKRVQDV